MSNNNYRPNNNISNETNCWVDPASELCESLVDSYLESQGLRRFRVKDDGNCLFYTVELWIRLNNYQGLSTDGRQLINLTSREIRRGTVDYGLENLHLISDLFLRNNDNDNNSNSTNNKDNNNIKSSAKHLKKVSNALLNVRSNKQWAGEGGDYMPLLLCYYTGLNLTIFNWSWNKPFEGSFLKIPIEINPGAPEVNILRINDNHFDLLIPTMAISNKTAINYNYFKKYHGKVLPKTKNNSRKNLPPTTSTATRRSTRRTATKK